MIEGCSELFRCFISIRGYILKNCFYEMILIMIEHGRLKSRVIRHALQKLLSFYVYQTHQNRKWWFNSKSLEREYLITVASMCGRISPSSPRESDDATA